jgi:hypothetical protein
MFRNYAFAGQSVPSVGRYWVHHYQHRLPHLATVVVVRFPKCGQCGDNVRFERVETASQDPVPFIRFDVDFCESCRDIPVRELPESAEGATCP